MEGKPDPPNQRGIIPHSFYHIFESVNSTKDQQFLIRASYLEIYNEEIRDLLSKDPKNSLELKENMDSGVYVKDLTSFVVKNVAGEYTHLTVMTLTPGKEHASFPDSISLNL
jgi:kinesin family protein 3/17